ncbi:MAG: T9SS type A sorting domain-containing protein [Ignavibacteria bacterium]|nr:T9SS type A sorting domain-containing protein [Ignavibacteria bacterium]
MKRLILVLFVLFNLSSTNLFSQALSGDYFIPQGANPKGFPTLSDAVTSINTNGVAGAVTFLLDADTLRENSFVFSATLSADSSLTIKPAPGRNVVLFVSSSASVGNGPFMIGFTKGYVTFDGSNNGTSSRNLIVSTEQIAPVVDLPFTLNHADADNVVLKNLIIKNVIEGQTNFRYGAVINDLGGVTGFKVENCQIGTPERPVRRDALAPWGGGATANQFSIVNNQLYCGTRGVATIYLTNSEIIGNEINILPTTAAATDAYNHGMYITGHTGSLLIHDNVINCIEKTVNASSYLIGIAFAGNGGAETDIISVVNNMINIGAANETRYAYGIGMRSTQVMGNLKVYYNTIVLNNTASTFASHAIGNHTNGTGAVNIDLQNNILINNHAGNVGSSAIGLTPATSVLSSNHNLLYANQNLVNYQGTLYANLAAWQVTTQDINSVSKQVTFVSATDLHLAESLYGDADFYALPMVAVTTDIDGDLRHLVSPYKGADELIDPVPVEFASFTSSLNGNVVTLNWTTASETNNAGFEIEKSSAVNGNFEKIGFVKGFGTTANVQTYSYSETADNGSFVYRLKQIDFDGKYNYSNEVKVDIGLPTEFTLSQNYPNPFNPNTSIQFTVPELSHVRLDVYSITGELVSTLVNEVKEIGSHNVLFNASSLSSGVYIYRMTAGNVVITKKMNLLK